MSGRVIYSGFETQLITGGIRLLSEHVSLLVAAGVEAYRWSPTPGFRYTWFHDDVPTLAGLELDLAADDILVLPEIVAIPGRDPAPGVRKVLFSQAPYAFFVSCPDVDAYPDWTTDPLLWTVSRAGVELLSRVVPNLPAPRLIPNPVDTEMFRPAGRRVPSIAWMPRKRPAEATLLRKILQHDPRSSGVELRELRGLGHREVARALSDTSVFIALGEPAGEGLGLPAAEALASGCLVVGYPGGGGEELFEAPSAWAVPDIRPVELADRALDLLRRPDQEQLRADGRQWVTERYNSKATLTALLEAVAAARAHPGSAGRATHPSAWQSEWLRALLPVWLKQPAA